MYGYKYECQDCGYVFDEPIYVYEPYETYGRIVKEICAVCPKCFGWALEEYIEPEEDEEDVDEG